MAPKFILNIGDYPAYNNHNNLPNSDDNNNAIC